MKIIAKNKKAKFNYEFKETYIAGISLLGGEVKSIRNGDVSINEAYIVIDKNNNLQLINMNIKNYKFSTHAKNFDENRTRQLLLTKKEIRKIKQSVTLERLVIIPYLIGISERSLIKLEIKLAKPRKNYDKREYKKEQEFKKIKKEYI